MEGELVYRDFLQQLTEAGNFGHLQSRLTWCVEIWNTIGTSSIIVQFLCSSSRNKERFHDLLPMTQNQSNLSIVWNYNCSSKVLLIFYIISKPNGEKENPLLISASELISNWSNDLLRALPKWILRNLKMKVCNKFWYHFRKTVRKLTTRF